MNKEHKKIISQYHKACEALAEAVNEQLFDGDRNYYWIADEVGGTCCFDDIDYLNPEDMVIILQHEVTYDQYEEWLCANLDHDQYINLPSWLKGCRHSMLTPKTNDNEEKDA